VPKLITPVAVARGCWESIRYDYELIACCRVLPNLGNSEQIDVCANESARSAIHWDPRQCH
jgi:hypothetical protein